MRRVVAALTVFPTCAIAQVAAGDGDWRGMVVGPALIAPGCSVVAADHVMRWRFGFTTHMAGQQGTSAVASEALSILLEDIEADARRMGRKGVVNLRVEATLSQDYVTDHTSTFYRGGEVLLGDGQMFLVVYGDAVELDCG